MSMKRLYSLWGCFFGCYLVAICLPCSVQAFSRKEAFKYQDCCFGVSKQFTIEDGPIQVTKKLDLMYSAGIYWRRPNLNWRKYEKNPSFYDQAILEANKRSICLAMMIDGWYGILPGQDIKEKKDLEAYKAFLSSVVERYDGDGINDAPGAPVVKFYQIGNEIGGQKHFWHRKDGKAGSALDYVKLLKVSYEVIQAKNPEIKVILGSLGAEDRRNYLQKVLDAGGGSYFDILDFHIYHTYQDFYCIIVEEGRVAEFKKLLEKYGFKKPIWVTETAESSVGNKEINQLNQAANLVKRNVILLSMGVEKVFTHLFDKRPGRKSGKEAHRGLLHYDITPKTAFHAYKIMTKKINHCRSLSFISRGVVKVVTCQFPEDNEVFITWCKNSDTVNLGNGEIRITDIYGKETIGENGAVWLTEVPIFIEKILR